MNYRPIAPSCGYLLGTLLAAYPITEYRFHALRKWRFDYAWPSMDREKQPRQRVN